MERKTYSVYKITAPDGKFYIGYTSLSLKERWRHHKNRALKGEAPKHPFYNAIRKYGAESFRIEPLAVTYNRYTAMELEQSYIEATIDNLSLNLSIGGINDSSEGGRMFWERLNSSPQERERFLKVLSQRKKMDDWTDYKKLVALSQQWRKAHPREAYRLSYRAIRIANRVSGRPAPCEIRVDTRPLKERLMHKYKLNEVKSKYVSEIWAARSEEEKKTISQKISVAQKKYQAELTFEERRKRTEKARNSIDRSKQGTAASKGIKQWWNNLRQNPEAYAAYIQKRKETLAETNRRKKFENV